MTTTVGDEFTRITGPHRRELLAHCYKMLGSVHDAEDLLQETLLRAWRSYGDFDDRRASMRTWLYRIATNACLTALEGRGRRPLPSGLAGPSDDPDAVLTERRRTEVPWLQPIPDSLLGTTGDPAAVVASRGSIRLAFVAALQHLPPRQRAVLILRDVLAWPAAEVAELIGTSTTAVNSALRRARARLAEAGPSEDDLCEPDDPSARALLERYIAAFESADLPTLERLLREDAELEMPPYLAWFAGRDAVVEFIARVRSTRRPWRFVPTAANGQPAYATYRAGDDGVLHAHSVQVYSVAPGGISRIVAFQDPGLFAVFELPATLDEVARP